MTIGYRPLTMIPSHMECSPLEVDHSLIDSFRLGSRFETDGPPIASKHFLGALAAILEPFRDRVQNRLGIKQGRHMRMPHLKLLQRRRLNMSGDVVLKRGELFRLIWSEPMTKVSARSDVALAKICRKMDIPRPDEGILGKKTTWLLEVHEGGIILRKYQVKILILLSGRSAK